MHRCSGVKPGGGRCERIVSSEQTYCFSHDPKRAHERRRNAAKGGKARATGEVGKVKERLSTLADKVEEGVINRSDAAVISQIWGTYIRAVSVEMKVREVEELAREIDELREILDARKEPRKWGT